MGKTTNNYSKSTRRRKLPNSQDPTVHKQLAAANTTNDVSCQADALPEWVRLGKRNPVIVSKPRGDGRYIVRFDDDSYQVASVLSLIQFAGQQVMRHFNELVPEEESQQQIECKSIEENKQIQVKKKTNKKIDKKQKKQHKQKNNKKKENKNNEMMLEVERKYTETSKRVLRVPKPPKWKTDIDYQY